MVGQLCGDHVTVLKVDKMAKSICVSNVVPLREPCSGISLADNGRFFHSLTHRGKLFVKFKVPGDQERVSKLAPLSKSPTAHKMDCNVMVKCKGKTPKVLWIEDAFDQNCSPAKILPRKFYYRIQMENHTKYICNGKNLLILFRLEYKSQNFYSRLIEFSSKFFYSNLVFE